TLQAFQILIVLTILFNQFQIVFVNPIRQVITFIYYKVLHCLQTLFFTNPSAGYYFSILTYSCRPVKVFSDSNSVTLVHCSTSPTLCQGRFFFVLPLGTFYSLALYR